MIPELPRKPYLLSQSSGSQVRTTTKTTPNPTRPVSLRRAEAGVEDYAFDDLDNEPLKYRAIMMPRPQKLCAGCHFSCLKCRGPNDYDCTACAPDALYSEKTFNESYCVPNYQQTPTDEIHLSRTTYIFLLILGPAIFITVSLIIVTYVLRTKYCRSRKDDYTYDRIEYDNINEIGQLPQEFYNDSSSSDTDE